MTQAAALPQPSPVAPEWGHPLLSPDGKTVRVLASTFAELRRLGAFLGKSSRLSPRIYQLIQPEFNCITEGLGRLLGEDLSGPSWILCTCKDCQRNVGESDHTALPGRNPVDDERTSALIREIVRKIKYT